MMCLFLTKHLFKRLSFPPYTLASLFNGILSSYHIPSTIYVSIICIYRLCVPILSICLVCLSVFLSVFAVLRLI